MVSEDNFFRKTEEKPFLIKEWLFFSNLLYDLCLLTIFYNFETAFNSLLFAVLNVKIRLVVWHDKLIKFVNYLPAWSLTILTVLAILWLTLVPRPLGDLEPPLFPGADKIAHFIMFGGLLAMVFIDKVRGQNYKKLSVSFILYAMGAVILFGILIEILQLKMEAGRSFEFADIIADSSGAIAAAAVCLIIRRRRV